MKALLLGPDPALRVTPGALTEADRPQATLLVGAADASDEKRAPTAAPLELIFVSVLGGVYGIGTRR